MEKSERWYAIAYDRNCVWKKKWGPFVIHRKIEAGEKFLEKINFRKSQNCSLLFCFRFRKWKEIFFFFQQVLSWLLSWSCCLPQTSFTKKIEWVKKSLQTFSTLQIENKLFLLLLSIGFLCWIGPLNVTYYKLGNRNASHGTCCIASSCDNIQRLLKCF